MASRRRRKEKQAKQRAQQQQRRPAQRVQNAAAALRGGDSEGALRLATGALAAAGDPVTATKARRVVVEAHFRLAAATPRADQRLEQLDAALDLDPAAFRLRYHRALTLWRLGRLDEAASELEALAAQDVSRRDVVALCELLRSAMGPPGAESPEQIADGPFRDHTPALWQTLRDMREAPKAAPVAQLRALAESLEAAGARGVIQYYLGVAAMRAGDVETGRTAWQAATEAGMATPWAEENFARLLQEQARALAQEGHWQTLVDRLQSHLQSAPSDTAMTELLTVAHTHLGYAAARSKDWNTAAQHWQEAASGKADRRLLQNLALAQEALGDWPTAATTWRQVIRRRPRKQDHADYLTAPQVAALWHHVVECYEHAEDMDEALACLRTALKYAPDDLELRLKAADIAFQTDRDTVAENELNRLLSVDPRHVPALERLASLYTDVWGRDPVPIWRRVLDVEPQHEEAREALARWYVSDVGADDSLYGWLPDRPRRSAKEMIEWLQEGLKELPGHPILLVALGKMHGARNQKAQARPYLEQAWEAAPQNVDIVAEAMHELLHVKGGDVVTRLLPTVREIRGLLAMFWVSQGKRALQCELGQEWVDLFWNEAEELGRQHRHGDTLAYVLVRIFEAANEANATDVAAHYEARLRAEHPRSGAVVFVDAYHAAHDLDDPARAVRLLRQAQQAAQRAKENRLAEYAEEVEMILTTPLRSFFNMLNPLDPFARS